VGADIQRFLSLMQKAHYQGMDREFSSCLAAYVDTMDGLLDDRRIGKRETDVVLPAGDMDLMDLIGKFDPKITIIKKRKK
jgi:hypothetical protein